MKSSLFPIIRRLSYILNNKLIYLDRLFLAKQSTPLPQPIFILGAPRSGTTLTYQVITQQFQVGYFIELMNHLFGCPNLLLNLASPFIKRPRPVFMSKYGKTNYPFAPAETGTFWFRWFPQESDLGHYTIPDQFQLHKYQTMIENIQSFSQISKRPMAFKSVYLNMNVGILAKIFPQSRFIFIKRNLIQNCQSLLLARQQQPNPQQWWSVKPPNYHQWLTLPIWQQVTNQVYYTQLIAERDLKKHASGRYKKIKYEYLCQQPQQFVDELTSWLSPLGFQPYSDMQVPKSFQASNETKLNESMIEKISLHLKYLEQKGRLN
ncbi:MAG: sulfotransferase [Anaerolineae bacterium]